MFLPEQMRIINNTILFTTDNWETSALALGKIKYGENGETAYGLIADVLVGNLVLGRELKILNENNSITLDRAGITIKKINGKNVFRATTDGDVYLEGEIVANKGKIGGLKIEENSIASSSGNFTVDSKGNLIAKSGSIGGYKIGETQLTSGTVGMSSDTNKEAFAFWAGNTDPEQAPFRVTNSGYIAASGTIETSDISVDGKITATYAEIGRLIFSDDSIKSKNDMLKITDNGHIVSESKIEAPEMCTRLINGGDGEASLKFTSNVGVETVTATLTRSNRGGNNGADINISIDKPLTKDKEFSVEAKFTNGAFHITRQYKTLIKKDESAGSIYVPGTEEKLIIHYLNSITYAKYISWEQNKSVADQKAVECNGNFIPSEKGQFYCGTEDNQWKDIWTYNISQSSDINEKEEIESLNGKYSELFDMLNPVSYKLKCETSDCRHTGLIANEVKTALQQIGMSTKDFAAYCEWEKENGEIRSGLRYSEFIVINIKEIQKLKKRIDKLESLIK